MIKISLWNIIFTVVNLLILLVAMRIFFFKPIREIIEKRQKEADTLYDQAKQEEKDAEKLKEDYEQKLADTETAKRQLLADARKSAEAEQEKILADARNEARRICDNAAVSAKNEHDKIIGNAKKEIADMVVEAVSKVAASGSTDENNSRLYDRFINEAGDRK